MQQKERKVEKFTNADLDFLDDEEFLLESAPEIEKKLDIKALLEFDSDFECGNLDLAALSNCQSPDEYDLTIRLDTNSRTHQ
jgi:hypothetical protein